MRIHLLPVISALPAILSGLILSGCGTIDTPNPWDAVPVDDLGDAAYAVPVAVATPVPRRPETVSSTYRAEPAHQAVRKEKPPVVDRAEAVSRTDTASSSGREMQRPSFAGLSASAPVPAFGEAPKRFVRGEDSGVQAVETPETPPLQPKVVPAARVVHVNAGDKYVILLCEKMPSPGEDAQLFRDEKLVGEVRFVSNRKGRYIVADIVSGSPQRGDIARYKCLFPQKEAPPENKRKEPAPENTEKKRARGMPLFF